MKREKEMPFVIIDLNIGPGKFTLSIHFRGAKIPLYAGEDPEKVANNYGKIFNLDPEAIEKLFQLIDEQYEIYEDAVECNYT